MATFIGLSEGAGDWQKTDASPSLPFTGACVLIKTQLCTRGQLMESTCRSQLVKLRLGCAWPRCTSCLRCALNPALSNCHAPHAGYATTTTWFNSIFVIAFCLALPNGKENKKQKQKKKKKKKKKRKREKRLNSLQFCLFFWHFNGQFKNKFRCQQKAMRGSQGKESEREWKRWRGERNNVLLAKHTRFGYLCINN